MPFPDGLAQPPASIDFKQSIADAIAHVVPEGKAGAFIAMADTNAVHFAVAAKIGDHWELAADAGKQWSGPITASVKVLASW